MDATLCPFDHLALGVTGAVEAANSGRLALALRRVCASLTVILSHGARNFVTPTSLAAINGVRVIAESAEWEGEVAKLSTSPMLIAPCTANTIAKLSLGISDTLVVELALFACTDLIIAPSVAESMWTNDRMQNNMRVLRARGVTVIEPTVGTEVATLQPQFGAMPKEQAIVRRLLEFKREQRAAEYGAFISGAG